MSMERWNPFREMDMMRQNMDRWFDDRWPGSPMSGNQNLGVAIDLNETSTGYELTASMPGVRSEDIDISVNGDTITLRGKSEHNDERQQGNFIYRERRSGSFQRTIRLPESINAEQVEAELDHGVLKITLPRMQRTGNRKVQIRGGMAGSQQVGTGMSSNQIGIQQYPGQSSTGGSQTGSSQMSNSGMSQMANSALNNNQAGMSAGGSTGSNTPNVGESGTSAGGTLHGSEAMRTQSYGTTGSSSDSPRTMERPEALNSISSTQMEEIDRNLRENDEQGYRRLAQSYGWDTQTAENVWRYMSHRATSDEARRAFENQGGQSQSQNRPS